MIPENDDTLLAVSDAYARTVSRICTEFFLESAVGSADFFKGELVTALVFLAIIRENVRHIGFGGPQAPPSDSEREPVTIYVVAKVLGLTYETARRHVKRLVDDDYCVRTERGLLIPSNVLLRPEVVRANERNLANFNLLLNNAVRSGLIEVEIKAG